MSGGVDGLEEMIGQDEVEHRDLIDDDQVCRQGVVLVVAEAAFGRIELEQAVQCLGRPAGGLLQALGRPARRRTQSHGVAIGLRQRHDGAQRGRLADTRATRQHAGL